MKEDWFLTIPLGLFVGLSILKICGWADVSWWWVTAPLWGPLALLLAIAYLAILGFIGFRVMLTFLKTFLGMRK